MTGLFIKATLVLLCLSLLISCGDGGGGSTSSAPAIFAEVDSFTGSNNSIASVAISDTTTHQSMAGAMVTINNVLLSYDTFKQKYVGNLVIVPGDNVTLSVTIKGNTYTATGNQFHAYPTISTPISDSTWQANNINALSWSNATSTDNSYFGIGFIDSADGNVVWPLDGTLKTVQNSVSSYLFSPNELPVGNQYAVVGIATGIPIALAASGSTFIVSGFDIVPLTIADSSGARWREYSLDLQSYLYDVTWADSKFMAVGYAWNEFKGSIYTSTDGRTWSTPILTELSTELNSVAWSGAQYVAVGTKYDSVGGHTGYIVTSADGNTWAPRSVNVAANLRKVIWAGTRFVAVGDLGTIITSPDGITWTSQNSTTQFPLINLAWSGSRFVVVGGFGTILTSPDGINWTPQISGTNSYLSGIVWSGSQFVAVGGTILTSPDGIIWTKRNIDLHGLGLYSVAWSGTNYAAVGIGSTYVSADGITWHEKSFGRGIDMYSVVWSGTQFLSTCYYYGSEVITSP